jgi:molybdopterin-dependent oxidoreductase alpha subunit
MVTGAPRDDPKQDRPRVAPPPLAAAGLGAVRHLAGEVLGKLGVVRGARTVLRVNQKDGFDCPGCAWPDGSHRHTFEFCENGVKAIAEEAGPRTVSPQFFQDHTIADLESKSDFWLGQQGRLTHPMLLDEGARHYRPISWDEAFDVIAEEMGTLSTADEAVFYTSGRASNEAAFLYQLFARVLGTNNLPDCSNMCHESSGVALEESIGIGKGSVLLDDIHSAALIVVVGQNPGTNHPRMLMALEEAKRNGARIVAINPLPEAGMIEFKNPQRPSAYVGKGTKLADLFLQVRLGGDHALFQALGRLLLEADDANPGSVVDRDFIERHTSGFDAYAAHVRSITQDQAVEATGLTWSEISALSDELVHAKSTIVCWAMGATQHRDAVATIQEFVNVLLLQGNIGRPGAGVCPVRGHSNVQGDRTMGIWERMPDAWLDRLGHEFGFEPPRHHGLDTVGAIRAMRDGHVRVFMGLGGNWVRATPDSAVTEEALRRCRLTVQISTKLNRSHTVAGRRALILPTLGRTDRDLTGGSPQFVTVEDSMGVVHRSTGRLPPASGLLRSEVSIIAGLAERVLGSDVVDWQQLSLDYSRIRDRISRVVPDHDEYDARVRRPDGFTLPHGPRDARRFDTPDGKAQFAVNPVRILSVPQGRLLLQTVRSHDQFNTTIYGLSDRYRGIQNGRRVVFVNPDDLTALGLTDGQYVNIVSEWTDGDRVAEHFRVVAYPTARGCAAAYFPETNVLVPLDSVAARSNTPTSKAIVVRLEPEAATEAD